MTRAVFVLILALATVNSFGQIDKKQNGNSSTPNNHPVAYRLFPTENMYTFILLDQVEGKTWQVQWSTDPKAIGIVPIE